MSQYVVSVESCSFGLLCVSFVNVYQFVMLYSTFGFDGMRDFIELALNCLNFNFAQITSHLLNP